MKKKFHKLSLFGVLLILVSGSMLCKIDVSMIGLDAGRLAVVEAVADQGVYHIERTHFKSVDKVVMNNHIYSDKPLLLSWCAAQVCKVVTLFTGRNFTNNTSFMIYLMSMIFGAGINALIFLWLFRFLCRTAKGDMRLKFLFALLCCCGSWLLCYMTVFLNHVPAALAVTGCMISLDKYRRKHCIRAAAWAGLSSGILFALDHVSGAVFLVSSTVSIWMTADKDKRMKAAMRCAACGTCMVLLAAMLNCHAYGTFMPLYLVSGGTYTPGTGNKNYFVYITEILFTHRGLFSNQPLLLLVFPAIYALRKKLHANDRAMLYSAAAVTLLYAVITNEYGGGAFGFRYLVCIIPMLMYYTIRFILDSRSRKLLIVSVILGSAGVVISLIGAYEPLCVTYEGAKNPAGHFSERVRNPFMSNLLAWSYETAPESLLTEKLIGYYGEKDSFLYLRAQYIITKHFQTLENLLKDPRFDLKNSSR